MKRALSTAVFMVTLTGGAFVSGGQTVPLSSLNLDKMVQGFKRPGINTSVAGNPISIGGRRFDHGIGTHAISTLVIDLNGAGRRFTAMVGVDDEANSGTSGGTVEFQVLGDGAQLWTSGVMSKNETAKPVDVDLTGVKILALVMSDGGDGGTSDHGDWAEPELVMSGAQPVVIDAPPGTATSSTSPAPAGPARSGGSKTVALGSLNISRMIQGSQEPQADKAVGGGPLSIGGRKFSHGVGTYAESIFNIDLKQGGRRFAATVGVDDQAGAKGSVEFQVLGDGQLLWSSELMKAGDPPKQVSVDLTGKSMLTLLVNDGGNGNTDDCADWADARIETSGVTPEAMDIGK